MLDLNGKIYLTEDTGEWFILDREGNFHPMRLDLFSPINDSIKHVYSFDNHDISDTIALNAKESFVRYLCESGLYTTIKKQDIKNIIY